MRAFLLFLWACALATPAAWADDESKSVTKPPEGPTVKKALNKAFFGRVVKIKKKRVTLYYDFEDPRQLRDFEEARPPRLLDASQNRVGIEGGRLVLKGSTSIRHRMEGRGEIRARFFVSFSRQWNVGAVITEPILSDFYVVYTLFDRKFNRSGAMYIGAIGLHEDEGANIDMSLVNYRDIFGANIAKKAKPGQWIEVEVAKDGWKEFFRVGETEGRGSSRGKTKDMREYQFGLFVDENDARFDDLTLTLELTDEFLELNDLRAELDEAWEEIPTEGPLAGIKGVPPRTRNQIEAYAAGKGSAKDVYRALASTALPRDAREAAARVLIERRESRSVPVILDGLYQEDKLTRKLTNNVIRSIVGKNFGYSPGASEKSRSKAIRKLNEHLQKNRRRYYR